MDSAFLSPDARGETRYEHRSPRSEALWRTQTGRSLPPRQVFDAFSPTEMSAPVVSAPASVRSGRSCVTGTRGGARGRYIYRGSTGPRGNTPPTGVERMEGGEELQLVFQLMQHGSLEKQTRGKSFDHASPLVVFERRKVKITVEVVVLFEISIQIPYFTQNTSMQYDTCTRKNVRPEGRGRLEPIQADAGRQKGVRTQDLRAVTTSVYSSE